VKSTAMSNVLGMPYADCLTPTGYELPADLSAEQWLDVGAALGRVRGSVMWWVGDWWAYGEHKYGERAAIVQDENWVGPAYQTCKNAATICRAFEKSRRRDLSFKAHAEIAPLPVEEQEHLLEWAEGGAHPTRTIRDEVKRVRALLAQGWTSDQRDRKAQAEAGLCVVANIRVDDNGQRVDEPLLAWAEAADLFVRIDRKTEWGNPFEMPDDGDRAEVIDLFSKQYWPHKRKLLKNAGGLAGKVLGCWCHPEPCHGHLIAECVNRADAEGKTVAEIADAISLIDG